MLIFKNDSKELMQIVQLATWKEFVSHVITLLDDDQSQLLIADQTNRAVAQTILSYGRDGPGLAIHKMLAEVLFVAGGSHVNPTLDRTISTVAAARIAEALAQDVLLAPLQAGVIPLPHQLHALTLAGAGDRIRYLMADEVGLGKTV